MTFVALATAALAASAPTPAHAGSREQALRIYNRIAGVPPSDAELAQMVTFINGGDYKSAVQVATKSFNFYNTNLVRFAHPMSNRDESPRPDPSIPESSRVPLNDYVATIVGMIRDKVPFDQVLYGDIIYTGAASLTGVAAFSFTSNTHYQNLGDLISPAATGLDLRSNSVLIKDSQTRLRPAIPDVAGVLTTRQGGNAFFSAGTNRRPLRYALKEFLCSDPAVLMDPTVPDVRIRQDVDRAPTGNTQVFENNCKACHAGIDGLAGAFAYFDFSATSSSLVYNKPTVAPKILKNVVFTDGYKTSDDSWINFWMNGTNSKLMWKANGASGNGANSLGHALAATHQFSSCMATRAFQLGCMRAPLAAESADIENLAVGFEGSTYDMRDLIENAAILPQCRGN
ncbi:MAG: hypothetical protein ACXVBW_05375 [Bdellovibrionota bacterium]